MTKDDRNNVGPKTVDLELKDGKHVLAVDTEGLIEIEDRFEGFMELLRSFATKPVKTIVAVLECCQLDGETWERQRITANVVGMPKMELAATIQMHLLEEMGYAEDRIDMKSIAKKLEDSGIDLSKIDLTKPETWVPENLSTLDEAPKGRKTASKKKGSISTRS